jgi:4-hydroxybenzoate polyprenyltransferase
MNVRVHLAKKKSMDIQAYIAIARPDHWFKNVFMLFGLILALFLEPSLVRGEWYLIFLIAVAATCLIASSNYVINEVLDAPKDRLHPTKRYRPVPSGRISIPLAYAEWFILASIGLCLAYWINMAFFFSGLALLVSGLLYNVPPIRTKDIPYLDVLSESLNNPIRLFLGWFALIPDQIPPISIIISYWMVGAFFMGAKRFAEFKMINDPEVAGKYRASFQHYKLDTLLISQFFYATACSIFFGIFIIRYHLELILVAPFLAGFFAYYVKISLKPNSSVQTPERLYKEYGFVAYACALLAMFVLLLFTRIEFLYDIFNVVPYKLSPLWTF